jgi:hypothetical protein
MMGMYLMKDLLADELDGEDALANLPKEYAP